METDLSKDKGIKDVNSTYRKMEDVKVSYADGINPKMEISTFKWVYETIISETYKNEIEEIRNEPVKKLRNELKNITLGYFNIGLFQNNYRKKENLISTEFMLFDYDHSDNITEAKQLLISQPNVYALFTSPSGDGLKVIFRLDKFIIDYQNFKNLYKYFAKQLKIKYGLKVDDTSDVSRACNFSYDPEMYVNQYAEPLVTEGIEGINLQEIRKVSRTELLAKFKPAKEGERHNFLIAKVGSFREKGYDMDFALELALGLNYSNQPPLPDNDVIYAVENLYEQNAQKDILKNFWSQGKEVYQIGFVGDTFFIEKIGRDKFNIIVGDNIQKQKYQEAEKLKEKVKQAYSRLVIDKHIKHLARVDYLGDSSAREHNYNVKLDEGVIEVKYAMLPVKIKDNEFVEDYLQNIFGEHRVFIKQYLAVYCHSNYKKLPTLIFYGLRGTGKTTYAEIMMEIFPQLSYQWQGNEQNFTPESEKKLLIVEENNTDKASQYKTLKKYTGQKYALVHKKFKDPYMVKNNMNIIILSNEPIPLYVKKEELPTDEANNQFFVFEFKELEQQIDNKIQQMVIDRLGYYIRTELKTIYESINSDKYRYSIPVPITKEEENLFNVNTTEIDLDTDSVIQNLSKRLMEKDFYYRPFIKKRFLPSAFIKAWVGDITRNKNAIIKNMKKRKLIEAGDPRRIQMVGRREFCYVITDEFYSMLTSNFEEVI